MMAGALNIMTTIVTVAFEGDYRGMRLQAHSLAKFCKPGTISRIIVIENFSPSKGVDWRQDLLFRYGHLASIVSFVANTDLMEPSAVDGWWSQQALKLLVAELVETPEYLLLDGKHHLIRPLHPSFWRTTTGKLRVRAASYQGHPLRDRLNHALSWFDLPRSAANWFPTTTPPFPISTNSALEVIRYAKNQSGSSLLEFMLANEQTEFFLYSCYLMSIDNLNDLYELHSIAYPCVWSDQHDITAVDNVISAARSSESPFFGIHRRAVPLLEPAAVHAVAALWHDAGLLPIEMGITYLREWQNSERRNSIFTKIKKRIYSLRGPGRASM